jgi:hypothetical protein
MIRTPTRQKLNRKPLPPRQTRCILLPASLPLPLIKYSQFRAFHKRVCFRLYNPYRALTFCFASQPLQVLHRSLISNASYSRACGRLHMFSDYHCRGLGWKYHLLG